MTGIASAIANRNSARCWIPVIGDSVTEGQGATVFSNRWVAKASGDLRTLFPTTGNGSGGGLGFIPIASTGSTTFTWPATIGSVTNWGTTPLGPVRGGYYMGGTGSWTWTAPSGTTSVQIMYYGTGNGSVIHAQVNAGTPVVITDSVNSGDGQLSVSIPITGGQVLTVSYVSGSSLYVAGLIHYAGDESTGIEIQGCGHYGWRASDWPGSHGFTGFPFEPSVATLATAALGFFLGINDSQSVNAATFQTNMIALINDLQSYTGLSGLPLVIVVPYKPNVSFVDSGGWNAYVTALYNVAANYSGTTVVDLNANMPPVISGGSLYYDNVHPSDTGHAMIASIFAAAMPAPVTGTGAVALPSVRLSAAGHESFLGSGGVRLPSLSLAASGASLPAPPPARIWRMTYCNRTEAMAAIDFHEGIDVSAAVDRAMLSATENIDAQLHRVFFPSDDTRFFDWPPQSGEGGGQYAEPWKLYLDDNDMVCLTSLTSGGVTIPLTAVYPGPTNNPRKYRPYYSRIELDRAQSFAFGNNAQSPQLSIAIAATWGYGADADPAGRLAAALTAGDVSVTLTSGALAGPGDLLVLGYGRGTATGTLPWAAGIQPFLGERVLVTDVSAVATGLTQTGSGVTTISDADAALTVTGTGTLSAGEAILLDSEQMLVEQVVSGVATVRRAYNGTALQEHSGATVYAFRQFSVLRAQLGTTAGAYALGAAVNRHRVPQLVRDLAIAESSTQLLQEGSGYARTVGSGESAVPAPGLALADRWAEARARHGRKARYRGV